MTYRRFTIGLVSTSLTLMASSAVAQNFSISPRATLGYQYYQFDVPGSSNLDVETDYAIGGLGLTGQINRFFVDLYGQTNITDATFDDQINNVDREADVDRYEINLTAGYAIIPAVTIFGGLKYAKTEIRNDFSSDDAVTNDIVANDLVDVDVDYFGPFAGAAYNLPLGSAGSLSISGSTAYLDGDLEFSAVINGLVVADDVKQKGEALGYNIGLTWVGALGPVSSALSALSYSVGVDYSAYTFDDDDEEQFAEDTVRGKIDLKYRF